MGFLSRFFSPRTAEQTSPPPPQGYKTFTEYAPTFSAWRGSLYEQLLTRTAVERFAVACSSLKPEMVGPPNSKPRVRALYETQPNDFMTWPTFLRRVATLYEVDTTAFIVQTLDRDLECESLLPIRPTYTELCEYQGKPWVTFWLSSGDVLVTEWSNVCVLAKFQLESDVFGGGNDPLDPTLALMDAQRQAEELAVKNGARIRFIGRVTSLTHEDDLRRKRDRFAEDNLGPANRSGLMVYDSTFDNITQVKEDRFTLDPEEMTRIENNVFDYFGTNRKILQNSFTEDEWNAYYEGKVEPFAIRLSEGLTKLHFTRRERKQCRVMFSSSRLQYASNTTKRALVADMVDRGLMTVNEAREILQLSPIEGGDVRLARGEFYMIDEQGNVVVESGGLQEQATQEDQTVTTSTTEEVDDAVPPQD